MSEQRAYYTISTVSKKIDIPSHVLRFWEKKFSDLKPRKSSGGRRFYSPNDIIKINLIKSLLYDQGFTISGAIKHLKYGHKEKNHQSNDYNQADVILEKALSSLNKVKAIIKNY